MRSIFPDGVGPLGTTWRGYIASVLVAVVFQRKKKRLGRWRRIKETKQADTEKKKKKRFTHSFLLSSESASPKKGKVKRDGG